MTQSQEMRWFADHLQAPIGAWFARQGQTFDTVPARTDHYLVGLGREEIAPKLREGKLEIKHRVGGPRLHALTDQARGDLEEWVKWSFALNADDPLAQRITNMAETDGFWMPVHKRRMGVKVAPDETGQLHPHPLSSRLDRGCQVEYTRVTLLDQTWYTFNLEWFGRPWLSVEASFFAPILGHESLLREASMGYGAFLQQVYAGF